jgi:DNA mismatch repair protein MutS
VRNYNVAVKEWDDQVVFLHQIVPGAADKSYGIHVAQLAGVPRSVNERAREVLSWLEAQHESAEPAACGLAKATSSNTSPNGKPAATNGRWQMSLFGVEEHPLLDEIRGADLDAMRPIEAIELLNTWQKRLINEQSPAKR